MDTPKRKPNRLPDFDYSTPGAYFITICVEGKRCILGNIVGGGAFDAPQVQLTEIGKVVEKFILSGNRIPHICVDKYVIMPNHIHLLLTVIETGKTGRRRRRPLQMQSFPILYRPSSGYVIEKSEHAFFNGPTTTM